MTDRIRERLKNQGVKFTQETARIQLELAGVVLSPDWTRHPTEKPSSNKPAEEPVRRLAGG